MKPIILSQTASYIGLSRLKPLSSLLRAPEVLRSIFKTSVIASAVLFGSSLISVSPLLDGSVAVAAEANSNAKVTEKKKRRRTPAMGSRVYSQLARAQELADAGQIEQGLKVLDGVQEKADSLNSYERAMMYNFYGFIYYNAERVSDAMKAFEQVVNQSPIPESLEKSTLFSLSQLAMANGQYQKTLDYLARWESVNDGEIPINNHVLKAQASYQAKNFEVAARYIDKALNQAAVENVEAKENWYVLQRAIYFELKQPKKVVSVLETMVRKFNKPEYWVQLGGMYGEIGAEDKQLAVLEAAYLQGYITKPTQLRNLAQLYYFNGIPFKAGEVMTSAFESGKLTKTEKNLTFTAQAWLAAKEYDFAVDAFESLSQITDKGDALQQIAEIRLQQGLYEQTITAATQALDKGELTNPGNLYLALGMAYFNLKQFESSIEALSEAKKHKSVQRMAKQWLKFVEREKTSYQELAML